jgi:hypothetical protein
MRMHISLLIRGPGAPIRAAMLACAGDPAPHAVAESGAAFRCSTFEYLCFHQVMQSLLTPQRRFRKSAIAAVVEVE